MGGNFLLITVCNEGGGKWDSVGVCTYSYQALFIWQNIFHNTQINNSHKCIIETAFKMAVGKLH